MLILYRQGIHGSLQGIAVQTYLRKAQGKLAISLAQLVLHYLVLMCSPLLSKDLSHITTTLNYSTSF